MYHRLASLRARFLAATLQLSAGSLPLRDAAGQRIGTLDSLVWARNRLTATGRLAAPGVTLRLGEMQVHQALPGGSEAPFALELPWPANHPPGAGEIRLRPDGAPDLALRLAGARRARARGTLHLAGLLALLTPDILRALRHGDVAARARIKRRLRFDVQREGGPLPAGLFAPDAAPAPDPDPSAVILLPVYNAFDLLTLCLDRVARHSGARWHLVAVEDASPDPRVRPALRAFAETHGPDRVTLIEQPQNQGFIAAVNAGLAAILARPPEAPGGTGPVVLLNSDALVPEGWLPRLLAPLADPGVASVTPLSNDAEIFTVPAICAPAALEPGVAERVDARAAMLAPGPALAEAPTGVGFCMALARPWLERVPQLDPAFGRGYGEEVDWCQRLRALGGRHMATARVFVEHRGGSSFGSEEKLRLIRQNNAEITRRYPGYDREVMRFIDTDPLRGPRLALAMAWAAAMAGDRLVPVYLGHSLGGGAEHWLARRIAADLEQGLPAVVLRVGGPVTWQLEVHGPQGMVAGQSPDWAALAPYFAPLTARRIVYSCGVGHPDPVTLPGLLQDLAEGAARAETEVLLHDYFPISPAFTLLDRQGRYHGAVTPGRVAQDPALAEAHALTRPDGRRVTLADWQQRWGALLAGADRILVFSAESGALLTEIWPDLAPRLVLRPHELSCRPVPLPPPAPGTPRVLGVLGNIAPHKGAALVQRLARLDPARRGAGMVLIGNIDPAFPLPRRCPVHSDYRPDQIADLARHYRVTHWLIPSLWPETFSFTTHEALATGLPVLAFEMGAQGGAVRRAENGVPLPHDPARDPLETVLAALRDRG